MRGQNRFFNLVMNVCIGRVLVLVVEICQGGRLDSITFLGIEFLRNSRWDIVEGLRYSGHG